MAEVRRTIEYFDTNARRLEEQYLHSRDMRRRLGRFERALKARVPPPAKVLDFGCGAGDLAGHLARRGYRVHGIDQSSAMVERARSRFALPHLEFQVFPPGVAADWRLPFDTGQFGACTTSSVLEYVTPLRLHLRELRRVVGRGGLLIASVPSRLNFIRFAERLEQAVWRRLPAATALWPRRRVDYLQLSVNRLPLRAWDARFADAGWEVESITGRAQTLALICARAV